MSHLERAAHVEGISFVLELDWDVDLKGFTCLS